MICALTYQLYTIQKSYRSQMISKKLVYNAAISAQLPSLASHSLKQSFHHCPINVPRKSQFRDGIMNAAFVTIIT